MQLIECVPNFSEGQRPEVIEQISRAIGSIDGVHVLNIDAGEAANRTVITFVGEAEAVVEGAFMGVKRASELIDMSRHHGTHPRIGATDVLPLVPVSGITLEECAAMARNLAERIWRELGIPTYCYEASASTPERSNLAYCRRGEYESLPEKMLSPTEAPDYGAGRMTEQVRRSGASVVGARNFLIAVNFNLNTRSVEIAKAIAVRVREKGRAKLNTSGEPVKGTDGKTVWIRGTLKGCKAIGWYIDEYGIAQVSMNITDIHATPLHKAYAEVCRVAREQGVEVTGTEIIGLVPEESILEAGRYFRTINGEAATDDRDTLTITAIDSMRLDDLRPFDPDGKIIERVLKR